jgi:hypothetical protein
MFMRVNAKCAHQVRPPLAVQGACSAAADDGSAAGSRVTIAATFVTVGNGVRLDLGLWRVLRN